MQGENGVALSASDPKYVTCLHFLRPLLIAHLTLLEALRMPLMQLRCVILHYRCCIRPQAVQQEHEKFKEAQAQKLSQVQNSIRQRAELQWSKAAAASNGAEPASRRRLASKVVVAADSTAAGEEPEDEGMREVGELDAGGQGLGGGEEEEDDFRYADMDLELLLSGKPEAAAANAGSEGMEGMDDGVPGPNEHEGHRETDGQEHDGGSCDSGGRHRAELDSSSKDERLVNSNEGA